MAHLTFIIKYNLYHFTNKIKIRISPTQLSHRLQCEVRGGRNILQVKQYLSLTSCSFIRISLVRGGGRYVADPQLSKNTNSKFYRKENKNLITKLFYISQLFYLFDAQCQQPPRVKPGVRSLGL